MLNRLSQKWSCVIVKFILICVLFSNAQESYGQCCNYLLIMNDTYGDGWNGATLEVLVNNSSIGTYSASGSQSSTSFEICNGDTVKLIYTPGQYEEENSYQLSDPVWNSVFSDGLSPQTGVVFNDAVDCNGVPAPGHFPCNAIPMLITECIAGDNTNFGSSGFNPGCASFAGGDIWFAL